MENRGISPHDGDSHVSASWTRCRRFMLCCHTGSRGDAAVAWLRSAGHSRCTGSHAQGLPRTCHQVRSVPHDHILSAALWNFKAKRSGWFPAPRFDPARGVHGEGVWAWQAGLGAGLCGAVRVCRWLALALALSGSALALLWACARVPASDDSRFWTVLL